MKTPWKKTFAAAAAICAGPASAIPVTFDFSGTVAQVLIADFATGGPPTLDLSSEGQAFSAQFIVDTDLFGSPLSTASEFGDRLTFNTELPGAVTSSLMINGESIEIAPFSSNRGNAGFLDSYGVVPRGLAPDQFNLTANSVDVTSLGPAASRALSFSFVADYQSFENPEAAMTWFDFSPVFGLDQIATLPLLESLRTSLTLSDFLFDCSGPQCQIASTRRTTFNVTSTTRTVASVPEPGALGLLVAGFAGVLLARRRRRALI